MSLSEQRVAYKCVANGYPDVRFLMWQSQATNSWHPQESEYSVSLEQNEFRSTVTTALIVEQRDLCTESRGYECVFEKNGSLHSLETTAVHCIPGTYVLF